MDPTRPIHADPERHARLALWSIRGLSSRSVTAASSTFGSALAACRAPRSELADALGLTAGSRERLLAAPGDLVAVGEALEAQVAARGGSFLLRGEAGYPDLGVLSDPPEALWVRGALGGAGGHAGGGAARPRAGGEGCGRARGGLDTGDDGLPPAVAVVGARKADPGAIHLARRFGASLAGAGYTVVSGGALGVDAAAHDGANAAGGATVAVLGSGVLRPLPARNRRLFGRMLAGRGGLVSELPPLEGARAEHFPRRNRLIAALARAVVVVRAAAGSGSLYTARAAVALGRPVFVVPAPGLGPASAGGEALLAGGAIAVRSCDELVAALRGAPAPAAPASEPDAILDALGLLPASVLEVAQAAGLDQAEVARRLADLCALGLVRPAGPGRFLRGRH